VTAPRRGRRRGEETGESPDTALTVSTLSAHVKAIVEGAAPPFWVEGEVTGFTAHRNGHWYFALRDARAQVRCVVWQSDTPRIPAPPDEGMHVIAFGRLSVYAARTDVQLTITRIESEGDGLWRKAFEQAQARLEADGLLDPARKRPLPRYPRIIAVVTSPDGAALPDIVAVVRRRDPAVHIVVVPATVQGEGAPASLRAAIARVGRWGRADLVIVGRGGGSRDDLWAFNDERVARAVAACPIPTISAVGHEIDVSLCDLVADLRAATPSAAAEAAVPVRTEVAADVARMAARLRSGLARRADRARADFDRMRRDLVRAAGGAIETRKAWLGAQSARLDALSPLRTLDRGYAVARGEDGTPLTSVDEFVVGGEFSLVVRDGVVGARTTSTRPEGK
jgi:exodeoxyribonuclease VII large subunit